MAFPPFRTFAVDLAREAAELVMAPPLPTSAGDVVVAPTRTTTRCCPTRSSATRWSSTAL